MKRLVISLLILFLVSVSYGDTYTSHQKPNTDSTLDIGTNVLLWRNIYAVGGIFSGTLTGNVLTDGTFVITGGVVTAGTWQGTVIDISDYTNLIAGTNITLVGDILNVDDAFLINDGDDTTTGTITAGGFTTTGTSITDVLIVGSNAPGSITSTGIAGTITWDSNYIYVAIANNSWKRVALSTWGVAGETMIYENDDVMLFENGDTMIFD